MVFCSSCGKQAAPGAKFCGGCGVTISIGTWGAGTSKVLLVQRSSSGFPTPSSSPIALSSSSSSVSSSSYSLLELKEQEKRSYSGGIESLSIVRECKEKWEVERRRVNEMELKFRKLIEAIKEERENKKQELEIVRKEKKELEDRTVTAESNLVRLIRAVDETKNKFEEEVQKWEQRAVTAENRTKHLKEKNKRLREKQKKLTRSNSKHHLTTRSSSSESAALRDSRTKIETLEEEVKSSKAVIEDLREQLTRFEENAHQELTKEEEKARRAEEETVKVSEKLVEVLDKVQVLEAQLRQEKESSANENLERSVLSESIRQLSGELQRVKSENEELKRSIQCQGPLDSGEEEEWKKKEQALVTELEEAETRVVYAETQQQELQLKVQELQSQLNELKKESKLEPEPESAGPELEIQEEITSPLELPSDLPTSKPVSTPTEECHVPPPPPPCLVKLKADMPPPPPPPFRRPGDAPLTSGPPPPPPLRTKTSLEVKPKVAMKMVNWSKIPTKFIPNTIFVDMDFNQTLRNLEEELQELESLFCAKVVKRSGSGIRNGSELGDSGNTPSKISLLELKRQQNVSIFLNSFRGIEFEEMKKAIETLDSAILNSDSTSLLLDNLPTTDEMKAINEHLCSRNGSLYDLADADRFFAVIGNIPFLRERLETHLYYLTFQHKLDDLLPKVKKVQEATRQVQQSQKFVKLLEVVLAIGNFMSSSRGITLGFKVESLPKLIDTKTTDNQSNLLQFLVRLCEKKYPELLNLPKELSLMEDASRIQFGALITEAAELKRGLQKLEATLEGMKASDSRKLEGFFSLISRSIEDFRRKNDHLLEEMKKTGEQFRSLEQRFSGTVDVTKAEVSRYSTEEFFGTLHRFLELFRRVQSELEMERVRKAREEAKKSKIQLQLFSEIQKGVKLRSVPKKEGPSSGFISRERTKVLKKVPSKGLVAVAPNQLQSELAKIGMFASQLSRERQINQGRVDASQELKPRPQTKKPVATKLDLLLSELAQ